MAGPSRFDHDQQLKDHQATDESLETERRAADDIAEDEREARVADLVRTRRADAERRLRGVRRDVDDHVARQAAIPPQVSGMLEDVAASLSKAAASLGGGAGTLPDRAEPAPHDQGFTPIAAAKQLTLETDLPGLRAASTDEGCLVSVADSGIGIPERQIV